jgi:alkylation response protein AidB-like acyl-CoA dehydrogenase
LFAADTANAMADRAVHYHGAIGAAVETGIHNYYRIVRALPLLAGPMSIQRRELADLILEPTWTSR